MKKLLEKIEDKLIWLIYWSSDRDFNIIMLKYVAIWLLVVTLLALTFGH